MKRRILEVDEDLLAVQVIEQLIKFMPAPEQMQEIAKYKDQYNDLAEPEQFAVEVRNGGIETLINSENNLLGGKNFYLFAKVM